MGILISPFRSLDDIDDALLDRHTRGVQLRRHFIQVQLERVGSCLLDHAGESKPRFPRAAIERSDDRYADRPFDAVDVLGIRIRTLRVFIGLGKGLQDVGEVLLETR